MEPQREYRPEEKPVVDTNAQRRPAMTAVWIAVAVLAVLGLYLAFPGTPEDASLSGTVSETPAASTETPAASTETPAASTETQAGPTGTQAGPTGTQDAEKPTANEGSPAKPDEKTQ